MYRLCDDRLSGWLGALLACAGGPTQQDAGAHRLLRGALCTGGRHRRAARSTRLREGDDRSVQRAQGCCPDRAALQGQAQLIHPWRSFLFTGGYYKCRYACLYFGVFLLKHLFTRRRFYFRIGLQIIRPEIAL